MENLSKWISATAAIVLLAGASSAADGVYAGKVKSINADKKEIVLTADDKDTTFKLADSLVVNRGGKESQSDLKAGDSVNVLFDKGLLSSTARYILVKEGDYQYSELESGAFKGYDPDKKTITITDQYGHDLSFAAGDAKVRVNKEDSKPENLKIGDVTLAVVKKFGDKVTMQTLMVDRK